MPVGADVVGEGVSLGSKTGGDHADRTVGRVVSPVGVVIAVHIAARVMAEADTGDVLVSRTVRDLVVGSDLAFESRGAYTLKGVQGDWELFVLRDQRG